MQPEYQYKELSKGVSLLTIHDGKFKSNAITVRFLTGFNRRDAAALALIPAVISSCCEKYPTGKEFSQRLSALYGTSVSGSSDQKGDIYEIAFSVDYLDDSFALNDEDISAQACGLLNDCIFSPAIENGGFAKTEFEMRRNDLLDAIDGEINDKISYALNLAYETVYHGEPSAEKYYGTRENVEKITPREAYEVYKRLLETAKVEISFCGCGDYKRLAPFFERFADGKIRESPAYISYSRCKQTPAQVEKLMNVAQANLVLAFKPQIHDIYTAQVMSMIYGGAPFSKLFANVREKLSLCYFCSAMYSEPKGTMFVVSAVEEKNIALAEKEIVNQLSLVADGDFSDDDIASAKLALTSRMKAVGDRVFSLDGWYNLCLKRGEIISPQEYSQRLNNVKHEDIAALARDMKLDTVFVLKNGGEHCEI